MHGCVDADLWWTDGIIVHVGEGPERTSLFAAWDDDEVIQRIIHELNFGRYAIKEKRNSKENVRSKI